MKNPTQNPHLAFGSDGEAKNTIKKIGPTMPITNTIN